MLARCNILAAVIALAGHLVGIVGLPSPAAPTAAEAKSTAAPPIKAERKCRCACGDGCGPCCCCSGETQPAPAPDHENEWHWIASLEVQKCFGIGLAGVTDLPPGLPMEQFASCISVVPLTEAIHPSPEFAVSISGVPPTPPPRAG
jgi:hypothetical protein